MCYLQAGYDVKMIRPSPDFDGPAAGDGGGHVALLGAGDVGVDRNHWLDGHGELRG